MNRMDLKPRKLSNRIQHYAWGAINQDAFIPKLLGLKPEPDIPYAELWMGAHPSAPSDVIAEKRAVPLDAWIRRAPDRILGKGIHSRFKGQLPFLFKVLSAGQPLSIQAHPDKTQAVELHARDPEHYPDENHKPEIAVAVDFLTALIGFKPPEECADVLDRYPEIALFIGEDAKGFESAPERSLRTLFASMMSRSLSHPDRLQEQIDRLVKRLSATKERTEVEALFLELRRAYEGPDIGLFSLFLLNLVHLKSGEGIFLKAGVPHAYVRGNIVECMANSDNVVRAGLTCKFKDIDTLTRILTYEQGRPKLIRPELLDTLYRPPVPEFRIRRLELTENQSLSIRMDHGIQVLLVIHGAVRTETPEVLGCIRGESLVLPAAIGQYTLHAETHALVFIAEPGISAAS